MDEQKPLSVNDILDQLVKPSVIRGGGIKTSQPPINKPPQGPPVSVPAKQQPSVGGIKLPQLSQNKPSEQIQASLGYPASIRLNIRTMADDLERLKQGKPISGINIENSLSPKAPPLPTAKVKEEIKLPPVKAPTISRAPQVFPPPRPAVPTPPPPAPTTIQRPAIKIPSLGNKKVAPPPPNIQPPLPPHIHEEIEISDSENLPPFPGAQIPKLKPKKPDEKIEYGVIAKIVSKGMVTGVVSTVLIAIGVYFLITKLLLDNGTGPITTSTPTPSITTIEQVNELEAIFKNISTVTYMIPTESESAISDLRIFIEDQNIPDTNLKRLDFHIATMASKESLALSDVLDALGVNYPREIKDWIGNNNMTFLYSQEGSDQDNKNRVTMIVEVKDIDRTKQIMMSWEPTMANDLKDLFNLDPTKQATTTFLDNNHRGVAIRYKNFPLPDKTIDYSIVNSLTGRHYLVLSNSRESMYSPTDKIRGL